MNNWFQALWWLSRGCFAHRTELCLLGRFLFTSFKWLICRYNNSLQLQQILQVHISDNPLVQSALLVQYAQTFDDIRSHMLHCGIHSNISRRRLAMGAANLHGRFCSFHFRHGLSVIQVTITIVNLSLVRNNCSQPELNLNFNRLRFQWRSYAQRPTVQNAPYLILLTKASECSRFFCHVTFNFL